MKTLEINPTFSSPRTAPGTAARNGFLRRCASAFLSQCSARSMSAAVSALMALCLGASVANASQMRFGPYTNFDGTLITNTTIIVQPVGDPAIDAAGNAAAMNGLPKRITVGADGMFTNNFQPQNYRITNILGGPIYFNKGYFFRAPLDSGPTVYSTTQPGVLISGQNYFVTLTLGTNLAVITYNILTNALGGAPLFTTNLPALTNGHITLVEATNVSVATANSSSNGLYGIFNGRIALGLTNAFATNAAGVSYANGRVYVSTNYDALGAANTASNNLLSYTLTLSNNLYTQITVGGINASTATNISAFQSTNVNNAAAGVIGTNGTPLTFKFSATGTNAILAIATPLTNNAATVQQLISATNAIASGVGISAATATNIVNAGTGVVSTNGTPLTYKFSSTGTNNILSIAQALTNGLAFTNYVIAATNILNLQKVDKSAGFATNLTALKNLSVSNLQGFVNGAGVDNMFLNISNGSLRIAISDTGDGGNMYVNANDGVFMVDGVNSAMNMDGNGDLHLTADPTDVSFGRIWLDAIEGGVILSNGTVMIGNGGGLTNTSSTNLTLGALAQSTNIANVRASNNIIAALASGTNTPSFTTVTASGIINGGSLTVNGGSAVLANLTLTLGASTVAETSGFLTGPTRAWKVLTITPGAATGPTNSFVNITTPVYATSFFGNGAGLTNTSSSNLQAQALAQVTNVVNGISTGGATSSITNAIGTNFPNGTLTDRTLFYPTNFVNPTNGFAAGLLSTNTALEGDVSFGRDGLSTNIISRTNYLAFINAGSGIATNGAFIWDAGKGQYTNWLTGAVLTNNGSAWLLKTNVSGTLYSLAGTSPIGAYSATDGALPAPLGVYTAALTDHMIQLGYFSVTNQNQISNNIVNFANTNASGNYVPLTGGFSTNQTLTNAVFAWNGAKLGANTVNNGAALNFQAVAAGFWNTNLGSGYGAAILSGASNYLNIDGAGLIAGGTFNTLIGGAGNADAILSGAFNSLAGSSGISSIDADVITGGASNRIDTVSVFSVIDGGLRNRLQGSYNFIGGGRSNAIMGADLGFIAGGASNYVSGASSFAAGQNVRLTNANTFAWSDGTATTNATNASVVFTATNGFSINTNWASTNTLEVNGWVDSTMGFTVNGVPIGGAGGSGTVTSVGLSLPSIFTVSGTPVTTSGTLAATLNVTLLTNNYQGTVSNLALTVANGITNSTLTASTLVQADANKKLSSLANGNGFLTNNGTGGYGFFPFSSLPGSGASQSPWTGDIDAGGFNLTNGGFFSFTGNSTNGGNLKIGGNTTNAGNFSVKGNQTNFGNVYLPAGGGFMGGQLLMTTNQSLPVISTVATNQYAIFTGENSVTNFNSTRDGQYWTNLISHTHQGTTTNLTLTFNGTLQTMTITNGPSIGQHYFFHYAGANGSISIRFAGSSYNNWHFDYQPTWLAGSNSVGTNGVLSITSYGGTNAAQLEAALKENPQ